MPTYGYQCTACQFEFQVFQPMKDDPIATCPECTGTVKRLLFPVGIVFKGSGWHINDYRKPDASEKADKAASESASKPETTSSETKTETKSETKTETKTETAPAKAAS